MNVIDHANDLSENNVQDRSIVAKFTASTHGAKKVDKDYLSALTAQIDASKLGTGISVLVNVRLSKQAPPDIDAFMSAVNRLPEIKECLLVTGNLDYVLKVETKDVEALKSFVLDELKAIPCVSETTTMLILEQAKGR